MKKTVQKLAVGLLLATGLTTNTFAQWQNVGGGVFSAEGTENTSLAFNPSGEPYVAHRDWLSGEATVKKYNGTSWITVGTSEFSAGAINSISLAFKGDTAYVAYRDGGNSYKATVMKFNGTAWVNVGTAGFSAGTVSKTSLAFSPIGEPYVAYVDGGNSNKATVMKFDGTAWVNVGTGGFSAAAVEYTSLAFKGDTAYVAYSDADELGKATVMKYDGTSWVNVGTTGFSAGKASNTSLAFSPIGEPYVAYADSTNSYKATVMKFNGTAWANVGTAGFSAYHILREISLAFNPSSGEPYVAFGSIDGESLKSGYILKYVEESTGINDIAQSNFTAVYPNPANSVLHIEVKENTNIKIVNMLGATVATQQLQIGNNTVDVSKLTNGVYFIQNSNGGVVKFIKD